LAANFSLLQIFKVIEGEEATDDNSSSWMRNPPRAHATPMMYKGWMENLFGNERVS
jgi:hypothetical protein